MTLVEPRQLSPLELQAEDILMRLKRKSPTPTRGDVLAHLQKAVYEAINATADAMCRYGEHNGGLCVGDGQGDGDGCKATRLYRHWYEVRTELWGKEWWTRTE